MDENWTNISQEEYINAKPGKIHKIKQFDKDNKSTIRKMH